jgi:N-glycosyltransferase
MRILVTTQPVITHLRAVAPAVLALHRRGHDVLVAVPQFMHAEACSYGLQPVSAGPDWPGLRAWPGLRDGRRARSTAGPPGERDSVRQFLGESLRLRVEDLLELGRDWRPDIVLRDGADFGGCLAAEVLGIPDVAIANSGGGRHFGATYLAAAIEGIRAAHGLPPDPDFGALHRYLYVSLMPPAYDSLPARIHNARCYRQTNPLRADESLPDWVAELPTDRPLVLASLGTYFHSIPGRMRTILDALEQVRCTAILRAGPGSDLTALSPRPENVRVVETIVQPLLLECCDLLVTHGGFQSVRESLRAGVPMVITPLLDDQPYNARRCAELGVARVPPSRMPGAEELAAACRQVLGEPRFRQRAREIQRAILALPSLDTLAADVEARFGAATPV